MAKRFSIFTALVRPFSVVAVVRMGMRVFRSVVDSLKSFGRLRMPFSQHWLLDGDPECVYGWKLP